MEDEEDLDFSLGASQSPRSPGQELNNDGYEAAASPLPPQWAPPAVHPPAASPAASGFLPDGRRLIHDPFPPPRTVTIPTHSRPFSVQSTGAATDCPEWDISAVVKHGSTAEAFTFSGPWKNGASVSTARYWVFQGDRRCPACRRPNIDLRLCVVVDGGVCVADRIWPVHAKCPVQVKGFSSHIERGIAEISGMTDPEAQKRRRKSLADLSACAGFRLDWPSGQTGNPFAGLANHGRDDDPADAPSPASPGAIRPLDPHSLARRRSRSLQSEVENMDDWPEPVFPASRLSIGAGPTAPSARVLGKRRSVKPEGDVPSDDGAPPRRRRRLGAHRDTPPPASGREAVEAIRSIFTSAIAKRQGELAPFIQRAGDTLRVFVQ